MFAGCGVVGSSRPAAPAAPAAAVATRTVPVPKPQTFVADRVIASRSGQINGDDVDLELTHLERTGQAVSLSMRLSTDAFLTPEIGKTFDDGVTQAIDGSGSEENGTSVDGVYLVDRAHAQKYLVARDVDGRCVCDVGIGELVVSGQRITAQAVGRGEAAPVASNTTAHGRALNRRVEIRFR